jgi:hypothetical protein
LAKGLTPIERAIAGDAPDRRRRYEEKMRAKGFTRATFMVHPDKLELLKLVAKKLREDPTGDLQTVLDQLSDAAGGSAVRPQRPWSEDAPPSRPASSDHSQGQ